MKKYLIDTNIFIDHLKGKEPAKKTLKSLSEAGEVYYSVVTRIELLAGIREKEIKDMKIAFMPLTKRQFYYTI